MLGLTLAERQLILDTAEQAYAERGMSALSLHSFTDGAHVSVANILHEFGSRQRLIDAMISRVLEPLSLERRTLLDLVQRSQDIQLTPAHVMACLVLPLVRDCLIHTSGHRLAFLQMAASDTDAAVRRIFRVKFGGESAAFDAAFKQAIPIGLLPRQMWKLRLFINASPGTVMNGGLIAMCRQYFTENAPDFQSALLHFAMLANGAILGIAVERDIRCAITETLMLSWNTDTLRDLRGFRLGAA